MTVSRPRLNVLQVPDVLHCHTVALLGVATAEGEIQASSLQRSWTGARAVCRL